MKKHDHDELTDSLTDVYTAEYKDGVGIPHETILFAGISMASAPKLVGHKLDAFAELFRNSPSRYKFAYLGDTLQRFNAAAQYILQCVNEAVPLRAENCRPSLFINTVKDQGNGWYATNAEKFNPTNEKYIIIRDSDIIIDKKFDSYLERVCSLYLNPLNQAFIAHVDDTVKQYMMRNKIHLPDKDCTIHAQFSLSNEDWVGQCITKFIQNKVKNVGQPLPYLVNPIYQALLKLSYSYVLSELAGFHLALHKLKEKVIRPSHKDFPIVFIYPGNLIVVQDYFDLTPNFNLTTKEIEYKKTSASSPYSSEKRRKSLVGLSEEMINDSTSPIGSPTEQEVMIFIGARMLACNAAHIPYSPERAIREMREIQKPPIRRGLFIANIGDLTSPEGSRKDIFDSRPGEEDTLFPMDKEKSFNSSL